MRCRFILSSKAFSGEKKFALLSLCLLCCMYRPGIVDSTSAALVATDDVRISLKKDESLRQISEDLLGDKDAWQVILRCNGINSPDKAVPGTVLHIPVKLYKKLGQYLERSASLISEANNQGAALLAEKEIARAVRLREQALRLRQEARLKEAAEQAASAMTAALAALEQAKKSQMQSAEAWLAAKSGTVQNRPPEASRWQHTRLQQKLREREKVRTLADSHCRIKFSDQSQLRLDEHALVVIGSMKKNVLRPAYKNSVSMIEGDILVHLASINKQKQFNVNLPNISTDIRSLKFLASRDEKNVTRIANYDGEIDVSAGGGQVTVKKNHGTKIIPGRQPTAPKELLPPPTVLSPEPEQKVTGSQIVFTWEPITGALHYQVEASRKAAFLDLLFSEKLNRPYFQWKAPSGGIYYFRIKTIDQDGCPGQYSDPLSFSVDSDELPPFLAVYSPDNNSVITEKIEGGTVEVHGEVEQDAVLRINGHEVRPDNSGYFRYSLVLDSEKTVIKINAEDEAGNTSTVERIVTLQQDSQLIRLDNPAEIISNTEEVSISGRLLPGVRLRIDNRPVQGTEKFTYMLRLAEGEHTLAVEAVGPEGQEETLHLRVVVDLHPPQIRVDNFERTSADGQIIVRGTLSEDASLTLNGTAVRLSERRFEKTVPLSEGDNELLLTAEDQAGNRTVWKKNVLHDSQPPEILRPELSPAETKGGQVLRLKVRIRDAGVGPVRSGSFTLEVDGALLKGILQCTEEKRGEFSGSVFVQPGRSGKVKVRKIRVQDMLGNTAEYPAAKPGE